MPTILDWTEGLLGLPINLPFTKFGRAVAAKNAIEQIINSKIDEVIADLGRTDTKERRVNASGASLEGSSVLYNVMESAKATGNPIDRAVLVDMCLVMLFAGLDSTTSSLAAAVALAVRGMDTAQDPMRTQADVPYLLDHSLWRALRSEQQ